MYVLSGLGLATLVLGGLALFLSAFGRMQLMRAVENTPTSKVRSAPMGKVELKGLGAAFGNPPLGPFSGVPCLWHRWTVEEERTSVDSKGRVTKSWVMIASGVSDALFQLEDSTGQMLVLPAGAEIDARQVYTYTQGGVFTMGRPPLGPLFAQYTGERRRFCEWRLDIGFPLYVLGVVRPGRENERISIGKGRADEPFIISWKSEKALLDSMAWGVMGRMVFGAVLCLGGLAWAAHLFLGW